MRIRKFIVKKPAGRKGRSAQGYTNVDDEVYPIESNQFFNTYSDGSREVRDIVIDYDDYKSEKYGNIKRNIANNIARLRKEKGLSCDSIAYDVGVSRQYISQIENGERNVTLENLSRIAESLDVNVEFLIRRSPFKPSNIYIDLLVSEIRELDLQRQKEICAEVIEKIWLEYYN